MVNRRGKGRSSDRFYFLGLQNPYGQWLQPWNWKMIALWKKRYDKPAGGLSRFSRVWLCIPMNCSPPGSSVHEISQARILGWVAMSFSRGSSWPRDRTRTSCIGRWVPYHWATREAINRKYLLKDNLECHQMITNHDQINKCQGEVNGKTCIFFNYTTKAT